MIFFLTTIIPSSNVEVQIANFKKDLFSKQSLIPLPFTFIPVSLSSAEPVRPTRKAIAAQYPEKLTPGKYFSVGRHLLLDFHEALPFKKDSVNENMDFITPQCLDFGFMIDGSKEPDNKDYPRLPSFAKYSLSAYEISCNEGENWWKNISWTKIWEVKKGKSS